VRRQPRSPRRFISIRSCSGTRTRRETRTGGNSAVGLKLRTISILIVDDKADLAELFRRHFRRDVRQGTYVMHLATLAEESRDRLAG